jgi:hypothetical protein
LSEPDDRALRDALEQAQAQRSTLTELERREWDLPAVRASLEAEVVRLEARRRELVTAREAALQERDVSADALVQALQAGNLDTSHMSRLELRLMLLLDGGQAMTLFVGLMAGVAEWTLLMAAGVPVLGLGLAGPVLLLLRAWVSRPRAE